MLLILESIMPQIRLRVWCDKINNFWHWKVDVEDIQIIDKIGYDKKDRAIEAALERCLQFGLNITPP